jgi:hypothetical protein
MVGLSLKEAAERLPVEFFTSMSPKFCGWSDARHRRYAVFVVKRPPLAKSRKSDVLKLDHLILERSLLIFYRRARGPPGQNPAFLRFRHGEKHGGRGRPTCRSAGSPQDADVAQLLIVGVFCSRRRAARGGSPPMEPFPPLAKTGSAGPTISA